MLEFEINPILAQDSVSQQPASQDFSENNKNESFRIQVNTHRLSGSFDGKVLDENVGKIQYHKNWLTKNCDIKWFLGEVILKGKSFRFGIIEGFVLKTDPKTGKVKEVQEEDQVKECWGLCLDFDGNKNPLVIPWEEILKNEFFQKYAVFIFTTPSYIEGIAENYRVVFLFDSPQPWQLVKRIIICLMELYPVDRGCKNTNRLWFGSSRNGKHHVFDFSNRLNIEQLKADGILTEDESKVTFISEDSEKAPEDSEKAPEDSEKAPEDEKKSKPILKTAPSKRKKLNPDDYDTKKQFEAIEQQNPGITEQVLKYLHDEVFIGKLEGDITKLYCLYPHNFREIPVDEPGMILKWEGANPWKPPTTDNPTSLVVSYFEGLLPGYNDRSGTYSSTHRLKGIEQHGGSFLDYYWERNKHKYVGTLQENFKQVVHDICDDYKVERFDFRSDKKSKRQILGELIQKKLGHRLAFNEMILEPELDGVPIDFDYFIPRLRKRFGIETTKTIAQEEILDLAHENSYHPVRNYLLDLAEKYPADSVKGMIDNLSTKYFGTDQEIYDIYVKKTLIAAVARVFEPGCLHKSVLVLQSDHQNAKKSTWIRTLIGKKWCNDNVNVGEITSKDDRQILNAFWGHEIDEIDKLFRKADRSNLKSFISQPSDNFRKPYASKPESHPRTSFFFGTTNERNLLHDPTGSVRFWVIPIAVDFIDADLVSQERDEIFAAAYYAYKAGEIWYLSLEEDKVRGQFNKVFEASDTWDTPILAFARQYDEISVSMILVAALNLPFEKQDRKFQLRVEDILRKNDWIPDKGQKRVCGKKMRFWRNPDLDFDGEPLKSKEDAYAATVHILFPSPLVSSVSNF